MNTLTRPKPTYQQVLRAARALRPADQLRLRDALQKMTSAHLIRPSGDPTAKKRGQQLAATVRAELNATANESLDETMKQMRGRAWSL
jgi:regulator of protease activity HflC (stomatin/prohibitin superfamily)